jgi:hypothetical protein
LIPLKDMTLRRTLPIVTILLIVANVAVFIHQISLSPAAAEAFVRTYALTPAKIQMALEGRHYTLVQALLPLFTCMFLHAGFLHILGNMWFLWIFGGNVEDRMGPVPYLFFYLVCGLGSGIAQTAFSWGGVEGAFPGRERRNFGRAGGLHRFVSGFPFSRWCRSSLSGLPRAHRRSCSSACGSSCNSLAASALLEIRRHRSRARLLRSLRGGCTAYAGSKARQP